MRPYASGSQNVHRRAEAPEVVGEEPLGQDGGIAGVLHAEADGVARVDRAHLPARLGVGAAEEVIEEGAVVGGQAAVGAVAEEEGHGRHPWFPALPRHRHLPGALGGLEEPVPPDDPFQPGGGVGPLVLVAEVARLPGEVVGEHRVAPGEATGLDDLPHRASGTGAACRAGARFTRRRCDRARREEVEEVDRPERAVVRWNAHRVQPQALDAVEVPLDHPGIVGLAPQPLLEGAPPGRSRRRACS